MLAERSKDPNRKSKSPQTQNECFFLLIVCFGEFTVDVVFGSETHGGVRFFVFLMMETGLMISYLQTELTRPSKSFYRLRGLEGIF